MLDYAAQRTAKEGPVQFHHILTDKHGKLTGEFNKLLQKHNLDELDLNGKWNQVTIYHRGPHPKAYHDFVYQATESIIKYAKENQQPFKALFQKSLGKVIENNNTMVLAEFWPKNEKEYAKIIDEYLTKVKNLL